MATEIPLLQDVGEFPISDEHGGSYGSLNSNIERSKTGGWKACSFILANEFCERLAYYGINTNLVVYLTSVMHKGNASAAKTVSYWSGTCYMTAFLGAFLADSYMGRYFTIALLSIVYAIGMVFLTLSASVPSLRPPACPVQSAGCQSASTQQLVFFYVGLYLIAFGTGGIKPCVSSFGADQFDTSDPVESKHMTSFFNWFYFAINLGALIASSILVYVQENVGWGIGFAIPTVAMLVAICTFFFGTPLYRKQKPGGSPLTRIFQVLVASFKKWRVEVPGDEKLLFELPNEVSAINGSRKIQHTCAFRFLDKAATLTQSDELQTGPSQWTLCTVTQVEEVKIVARVLPIWASTIVFSTVYCQVPTTFVEQGRRMETQITKSFTIPAASLSVFCTLTVIIGVPLYDYVLIPYVRRFTGVQKGFNSLQRMAVGLWLSTLAMVTAALLEYKRLQLAAKYELLDNDTDPVPISVFWQMPQYLLVGAAEVFTAIGQLEFFYDQSPDAMRSLGVAMALSTVALGSYLNSFVVTVVTNMTDWIPDNLNRGHLDYFFVVVGILSLLSTFLFLACSRNYQFKQISA